MIKVISQLDHHETSNEDAMCNEIFSLPDKKQVDDSSNYSYSDNTLLNTSKEELFIPQTISGSTDTCKCINETLNPTPPTNEPFSQIEPNTKPSNLNCLPSSTLVERRRPSIVIEPPTPTQSNIEICDNTFEQSPTTRKLSYHHIECENTSIIQNEQAISPLIGVLTAFASISLMIIAVILLALVFEMV